MWVTVFGIAFWLAAAVLVYTYVGYPLVLLLLSRFRGLEVQAAECAPPVTVIITAYNEERDLAAKLENTLALDYPTEKLEIIVASDCSDDRTDQIAKSFGSQGVRLHRQKQRLGKTAAQNAAVELAKGDIIFFSDATTLYRPDVLKAILPNFSDHSVGCVGGELIYVDRVSSGIGTGAVSYWNYEVFLKRYESRVCSLIGVSGCLYAVRRSAYVPLYNEACSDFIIATKMVEQGLRAVYEPNAICEEETNSRSGKEFAMRVRVIAQTYNDLWLHRHMMNPFRSGIYAIQLLSHKVLRYMVPGLLLVLLVINSFLALGSSFYRVLLIAQLAGYAAALLGYALSRAGIRTKLLALPYYFLLANVAAAVAFVEFLRGNRYAKWEPVRDSLPISSVTIAATKSVD